MPYRPKKRKKKTYPKGYDSGLEYDLHKSVLSSWSHHPDRIPYVSKHTYEPDFVKVVGGKTIYIEVKGRFRDSKEAKKYIDVREVLGDKEELVFIFSDANKPMPNAKKRKDGTKHTHGEWADKNNFRYYCNKKGLPKVIK